MLNGVRGIGEQKKTQPQKPSKSAAQTAMTSLCQRSEVHCIARSQKTTHSDTGTCRLLRRLNAHNRRRLAMSEAKPTPGPWVVLRSAGDEWYFRDGEMTIARAGDEPDAIAVMDASAKTEEYFGIFAEALNMRDETGLTPRQLVERVKELEEALQKISAIEDQMYGADWEEIEEARGIADAALSKSLPNTVAETPT